MFLRTRILFRNLHVCAEPFIGFIVRIHTMKKGIFTSAKLISNDETQREKAREKSGGKVLKSCECIVRAAHSWAELSFSMLFVGMLRGSFFLLERTRRVTTTSFSTFEWYIVFPLSQILLLLYFASCFSPSVPLSVSH